MSHATASTILAIVGEPVGFDDRTDSEMFFDNGTRLFTIQPKAPATSFAFYQRGQKRFVKDTPQTIEVDADVGIHWIYFGHDGNVQQSTAFPGFDVSLVALLYWDGAKTLGVGDERHGAVMPWVVHQLLHLTVGTRYQTGGGLVRLATGGGGANADAQVSVANLTIWDEDIRVDIVRSAVPVEPFEQELGVSNTIPGQFPVYYRIGADGHWTKDTATTFPMRPFDGSAPGPGNAARVGYNLDTAGTWSVADPGANNRHVAYWILGTNSQVEPVIAVMGQRWDANQGQAADNNQWEAMDLGDLPFAEMKLLFRLIVRTSNGYANDINAQIREVQDLRPISNLPAGTYVATSHGALGDLAVFPAHPSTAIMHEQAAPPVTGELGQLIWDVSAGAGNQLKVWDGAGWKVVTYTP